MGLKGYYEAYFPIGASVGPGNLRGQEARLLRQHFSSLTAENVMKMGPIHPEPDRYRWDRADSIADFAARHGMNLRGHTLCWHMQVGRWMFVDPSGDRVGKEVLLDRLRQHIETVAGRYRGRIYAWDVVNEAVSDSAASTLRRSPWHEIIGPEYIARAFEFAHAADPEALLFYNDYNATRPVKRAKIIRLVRGLLDQGVPIHGVGIQGHWSIYGPDEAELRAALDDYAQLGLPIQITELDVSVYPPEGVRRDQRPDESDVLTPELEQRQLEYYRMIFRVFRDYRELISGVTFWNVSDRHSWLDNFPVRGRKNYPLLFDQELRPKKAYWAVVSF